MIRFSPFCFRPKVASPELSVKTGPHAPLCETTKSGFDLRVQETDGEQLARAVARLECR